MKTLHLLIMKNIFTLISVLLFSACIEIRISEDGSRDLEQSDVQALSVFNSADAGKDKAITKPDDILFQEIGSENLKKITKMNRKTWIYVWGSWCTPCRKKLPLIAQIHRDNPDWNVIMASDDYKIEVLQKLLFEHKIFVQPYILDKAEFGIKTHVKEQKLWEAMDIGKPYADGVPQNYIFDEKGNLIYYGSGSIPEDLMNTLFVVR